MRKLAVSFLALPIAFGIGYKLSRRTVYRRTTKIVRVDERPQELHVAEIFGRSTGCESASPVLIEDVTQAATKASLTPALVASIVAQESQCYQYAVSVKGAIGLMQIHASAWRHQFDFAGKDNLFNEKDNLRVGSDILAMLIKAYGQSKGVTLYQGGGSCPTCDVNYRSDVINRIQTMKRSRHVPSQ